VADIDFLSVHAADNPTKTALVCGRDEVDFATLSARANRAGHAFLGLDCQ